MRIKERKKENQNALNLIRKNDKINRTKLKFRKFRNEHKNTLKKKHVLYNLLRIKFALKRAHYNPQKIRENALLNSYAVLNEKKEQFLLNFILKIIRKKALKFSIKNRKLNKLKTSIKASKNNLRFLNLINVNRKLLLPKRGTSKYKFLITRALDILKKKVKILNKKIYAIKLKMKKRVQGRDKYRKMLSLLLKKQRVINSYLKMSVKSIKVKPYKQLSKRGKQNVKINYEPSLSGKTKIKVKLTLNTIKKKATSLLTKIGTVKTNMKRNLDYFLFNKHNTTSQSAQLNSAHLRRNK